MKQTATEYLFEKLWAIPKDKFTWQMILQEAKKKEKRQIEDAYDLGIDEGYDYGYHNDSPKQSGKEYYKETYEQK
jgi:hypothetical protein